MSLYKSYKNGSSIGMLVRENGVRKTFNALKRKLGNSMIRIKHNKLQIRNRSNNWQYT